MNYVKEPWKHQREAVERAVLIHEEVKRLPNPASRQSGFALFFEPRCGKSATLVNLLRYLCNRNKARLKTLIFCPPRVVPVWKKEFLEHSKFVPENIVLLRGSGEKRLETFKAQSLEGAHIFVTNYESLLMKELFDAFLAWRPDFLGFDEAHRLKDPKAKRSKAAELLANPREKVGKELLIREAPYKMILTGSPILTSLMDLYQQFKILDGGETFGYYDYRTKRMEPLSYRGFLMTYFTDRNAGMPKQKYFPKWELKTMQKDGFDGLAAITAKIQTKSMRVERKDVLELPPTSRVVIQADLSPEQKRLYMEMKRDFVTEYRQKPVVARMALTKTIRLLQITSGFVKTDQGEELYLDDIPKKNALQDLLVDLLPSGKCLVWSVFKENYRQIREVCESLGVAYVEVHGEISSAKQDANVKEFQTNPEIKVFIGHPESGGEGLNLVQAPYNIFYSRNHSLKHSLQASARNQSQDSRHEKTVRYDIVARGTLDEIVADHVVAQEAMTQEVYAELILKNILQDEITDCKLHTTPSPSLNDGSEID